MGWTKAELARIAAGDDLRIAPFREDGVTYGTPTWIWSVVVEDALYVRAYNGRESRWHKAAIARRAGRVTVAGMTREVAFEPVAIDPVAFEPVDGPLNGRIDDAYRAKYASSGYLRSMISERARAATVRIVPRSEAAPADAD